MNEKKFDLEDRTFVFARDVRSFLKKLPFSIANKEDGSQLVRASGSVGANYIEANESVSRKDYLYRVKVCKKESKESGYWLRLVDSGGSPELENERTLLLNEAIELCKIFGAIIIHSDINNCE
jgi:four helix bundle protein